MSSAPHIMPSGVEDPNSGKAAETITRLVSRFFSRYLSKVELADEYERTLKALAEKGVVVYALKYASHLNCLILQDLAQRKGIPQPLLCHGISSFLWRPAAKIIRSLLASAGDSQAAGDLERMTRLRAGSVIFLRGSEREDATDPLVQLLNAQKGLDVPVYIVPMAVSYGPRREKKDRPLVDIFFGDQENPGSLRRLIAFIRYKNRTNVVSAEAIDLSGILRETAGGSLLEIAGGLRGELIGRIDRERSAAFGPRFKPRQEIMAMAMRDERLVRFLEEHAGAVKKDLSSVQKQAKRYLKEIAADYSDLYVELWEKALTWLWNNIYDGVVFDREGLARVRELSRRMPCVIIPCHRSHIDYLLLSYVFYKHNIPLPFVAAGTNLMFWPLGPLFRKSGAFFIRRTFGGNILYREVMETYVRTMLQEGYPIEFFIEGGRSRTGKMIMPKYGMLSMVIQACTDLHRDVAIVPVFIGYDRVMEEKSYLQELGGAEKERERASSVIKSSKLLNKRYGRVYVNIGEPIYTCSSLQTQDRPPDAMEMDERRSFYRKISYEVVSEISRVSVVTPFALVAAALLCHYKRGLTRNDLLEIIHELFHYLASRGVSIASTFANPERAIQDALEQFKSMGLISEMGAEEGEEEEFAEVVYSLDEEKRLHLEYYKNNILHFFVPLSFVAASILSRGEDSIPLVSLMEDYKFFKRLFRHEFIFDHRKGDAEEVHEALAYLLDRGMIVGFEKGDEAWIEVKGKGRLYLRPYAGLIQNYIESYWVVTRGSSYLRKDMRTDKEFLKLVQKLGTRMYKKGEILRNEAQSVSNYQNAMKALMDEEILNAVERKEKKETKVFYSLTENKARIEALRQRIFRFL
ncbi:MAG TPA: 1-acyl-sn-glycerol-3-phosphate acyltransferase [Syntrophales bacterium]|nr:1-acyl-sn-glycerol-3-phosphate acyltransferase [Syntrophales bacterium]